MTAPDRPHRGTIFVEDAPIIAIAIAFLGPLPPGEAIRWIVEEFSDLRFDDRARRLRVAAATECTRTTP